MTNENKMLVEVEQMVKEQNAFMKSVDDAEDGVEFLKKIYNETLGIISCAYRLDVISQSKMFEFVDNLTDAYCENLSRVIKKESKKLNKIGF